MISSRYQRIAFFDSANVVAVRNFDLPTRPIREPEMFEASLGYDFEIARRITLEAELFDLQGKTQLETWQLSKTPIGAVALGARNIQWLDFSVPDTYENVLGSGATQRVHLKQLKYNSAVYQNVNLLRYLGIGTQTFGSGFTWTSTAIMLPFQGISLNFVVDVLSGSGYTLRIDALNSAGAVVGTASKNHTGIGQKSVQIITPANTFKIRVQVSGGTATSFRTPTLRTDCIEEVADY